MKPLQIKMAGFGSYAEETVISFDGMDTDLFLITGDTGAGKTTIFDAITYALYGETSGSKKENDATQLHSQYPGAAYPYVEFTFSEGDGSAQKVYTVRREPPHLRPITRGARKGQLTEQKPTVCLSDPDGTEYTGTREVNQRLQDLVGLTKEQFTQVAMLAQGEFMTFLGAKSDDKRPILRKLFGTKIFGDIQSAVARKAKECAGQTAAAWYRITTLIGQVQVTDDFDRADHLLGACQQVSDAKAPDIAQAETVHVLLSDLASLQNQTAREAAEVLKARSDASDQAQAALKDGEKLDAEFAEAEKAAAQLAELQVRQPEMEKKEELLDSLRKAGAVRAAYVLLDNSKKSLAQKKAALEAEQSGLPDQQKQLEGERQEALAADQAAEKARIAYGQKKQQVQDALRILDEITEAQKSIVQLEQAANEAQKESSNLQQTEQKLKSSIDAGRAEREFLKEAPVRKERLQHAGETIRTARKQYQETGKCHKTYVEDQQRYRLLRAQYLTEKEKVEAARQAYFDNQAGLLAEEQLEPGKPCPVCGSLEHPNPAVHTGRALSVAKLKEMQKDLEQLDLDRQQAAEESAKSGADLKGARDQLQDSMTRIRSLAAEYDIQAPEDNRECLIRVQETLSDLYRTLQRQTDRFEELGRTIHEQETGMPKLQERARQAEVRRQQALEEKAGQAARLTALQQQVSYASQEEAKKGLRALASALQDAEALQKKKADAVRGRESAVSATQGRIEQLLEEIPRQEEAASDYQQKYEEELRKQGFSDSAWQPLASAEQQARISPLEQECQAFKRALHTAAHMREHTAAKVAGKERPDLEKSRADAEAARTERDLAFQTAQQAQSAAQTSQRLVQDLGAAIEAHRGPAEQSGRLDRLSKRLSGGLSGNRIDLETFVLRHYLEDILVAANRRFREMTGGEYELRLLDYERGAQGNHKSNAGLDLTVYSRNTDATRNIDTLSGGESFMAALSLSLGMADIIGQYSSAVKLDIMFIDEGFGSLDDNSRREAVKILQSMTEGSKLVGIISHVSELKNEIDRQLIVTKNANGSHARWVSS